jgi:hypothetical protein
MTMNGSVSYADGVKQTFNPNGTNAGLNVGSQAGDPSTPANGDLWYDSTANELTARINGANVALGAGGGGGTVAIKEIFNPLGGCGGGGTNPAFVNWYRPGAASATIGCRGNTFEYASLAFTELSTVHIPFAVPAEWTSGAVTLTLFGTSGGTEAGMTVDVSTKCIANGEAFDTITYNTAQTIVVANGTAGDALIFGQSGLTMTGCAAGEKLLVKVSRTDPETAAFYLHDASLKFVIP